MGRTDSGFDASWYTKATEIDSERIQCPRSNTAPTQSRRSRKSPSKSPSDSNPRTISMENIRPASEKRPSAARRSTTQPRRPSIASSSENSTTKSRSRGHGSKPSSRRTSCTLVDPSRPTRHYRINSSQTVPTGNRADIDDVLALHFRSCSLFENPSYYSPVVSPAVSGRGAAVTADIGSRYANSVAENTDYNFPKTISNPLITSPEVKQSEDAITPPDRANTTMHWMSPSTRKRQYEKIDKANSGLRGFVSRIVPRCVSGPPPPKFYEKDQSDTGSVRRYRINNDEEEEQEREHEKEDIEKSTSTVRPRQIRTLDRSTLETAKPSSKSKRWGCF